MYHQNFKDYNLAKQEFRSEDKEDLLILHKAAMLIFNNKNHLFPESCHSNLFSEDTFDCIIASLFILADSDRSKFKIMTMELADFLDTNPPSYEALQRITNHPYSVILSVIYFVMISVLIDNEMIEEGFTEDFHRLMRDYLKRNLKIDSFFILDTCL